eukprot:9497245-Pyramimonas_sp.AAC.1
MPEVLHKQGISDHAPVVVTASSSIPKRNSEDIQESFQSIPRDVYRHPKYAEYLRKVSELPGVDELSPPLALDFVTKMMREAAR